MSRIRICPFLQGRDLDRDRLAGLYPTHPGTGDPDPGDPVFLAIFLAHTGDDRIIFKEFRFAGERWTICAADPDFHRTATFDAFGLIRGGTSGGIHRLPVVRKPDWGGFTPRAAFALGSNVDVFFGFQSCIDICAESLGAVDYAHTT